MAAAGGEADGASAAAVPVGTVEAQLATAAALDAALVVRRCSESTGVRHASLADMWAAALARLGVAGWYAAGAGYWQDEGVPATLDGVLGGYAHVSSRDADGSRAFIGSLRGAHADFDASPLAAAVDCGAGIGRVAAAVLSPLFGVVDLVEQSPRLVAAARAAGAARGGGRYICAGLQVCCSCCCCCCGCCGCL